MDIPELYPYLYICSCLVTQSIEAPWWSITTRKQALAGWDVSNGGLFIDNWSFDYHTKDGDQMQVVFLIYLLNWLIYEELYTTKIDVNCPATQAFSWSLFSLVSNRRSISLLVMGLTNEYSDWCQGSNSELWVFYLRDIADKSTTLKLLYLFPEFLMFYYSLEK